jgi:hypothetical protein
MKEQLDDGAEEEEAVGCSSIVAVQT